MNGTFPCTTGAGMVKPMRESAGICSLKFSTISATTAATFLGLDFEGVGIRTRASAKSPSARSTGAPLMPEPPTSMPRMFMPVSIRVQPYPGGIPACQAGVILR